MRPSLEERFWAKVEKTDTCWLWLASHKGSKWGLPYGRFGVQRDGRTRIVPAHRMAWALANGEPPEHLMVCHRCDIPSCVNPSHLFLGTQADNMRDMAAKGRNPRGESHWRAVLTEDAVRCVLAAKGNGAKVSTLATEYGVAPATIRKIVRREHWRHVTPQGA